MDILKNQQITKEDIQIAASSLLEQLDSGEINPLALLQRIKAVSKLEEILKDRLRDAAVTEALKYKEKEVALFGSSFKVTESGVSYDYSVCGDPIWQQLNQAFDSAKQSMKDRETFLRSIKGHETVVDESSGEIVTVYEPVRKSTTTVQVTIK